MTFNANVTVNKKKKTVIRIEVNRSELCTYAFITYLITLYFHAPQPCCRTPIYSLQATFCCIPETYSHRSSLH